MKHSFIRKTNEIIDVTIEHGQKQTIRLNKYISDSGYCSRREADRLIEAGQVVVDGQVALMGQKISDDQEVIVQGKVIQPKNKFVYIALNKPIGITCTTDLTIEGNINHFMNYPIRIFPIGRLDKDSSGLILLTNDGDIVNKILRSENHHEKEYLVHVNYPIDQQFKDDMEAGIEIYNSVTGKMQKTKPCQVEIVGKRDFKLILTEGMNRQIRRMTKALGYRVDKLHRTRIMHIHVGSLKIGEYRYLTNDELMKLNQLIQSNHISD